MGEVTYSSTNTVRLTAELTSETRADLQSKGLSFTPSSTRAAAKVVAVVSVTQACPRTSEETRWQGWCDSCATTLCCPERCG